jgi:aspartyl protease family protein
MRVNGTPITFMVDTGASVIALSREDAARLGISTLESDFTDVARTASGEVGLKSVTLDRVALGSLEASQVEAAVVQQGLDISLLGQSWLKRVGTVKIEGDKMIFR